MEIKLLAVLNDGNEAYCIILTKEEAMMIRQVMDDRKMKSVESTLEACINVGAEF